MRTDMTSYESLSGARVVIARASILVMAAITVTAVLLTAAVLVSPVDAAYAQDKEFTESCSYDGRDIDSDYSSDRFASVIREMEPGDTLTYTIRYKNNSSRTTLWYLKNSVLETLEDNSDRAKNGGYTYRLSNDGPDGSQVFFDNSEVGGDRIVDGLQGLKQATSATENYFFIQELEAGESGKTTLFVEFDGETGVNSYMDTKGALLLKYAVQEKDSAAAGSPGKDPETTSGVRTGDRNRLMFYVILLLTSSALLVIALILHLKKRKEAGSADAAAVLIAVLAGTAAAAVMQGGIIPDALIADGVYAETGYKYTVTVYSGREGKLGGGKVWKKEYSYGERCELSADSLKLKLTDDRYYARGFRIAGHDNDETTGFTTLNFNVTEDVSYEVAYGIRGELVRYYVKYVDEDGSEIHDEDTFYGMAGDKPVVAYRYISGYDPDVYNMSRTLSEDESENVFTFRYTEEGTGGNDGDDDGDDGEQENEPAGAGGAQLVPAPGTAWNPAGTEADGGEVIEDDERPLAEGSGDEDEKYYLDLDDREKPKAAPGGSLPGGSSAAPAVIAAVIGLIVILIIIAVIFRKRKHDR